MVSIILESRQFQNKTDLIFVCELQRNSEATVTRPDGNSC